MIERLSKRRRRETERGAFEASPELRARKNLYRIPISFLPAPSRTFMAIGSIFHRELKLRRSSPIKIRVPFRVDFDVAGCNHKHKA